MPQNVLVVAFHYPPVQGSSGVQRTLSFTRYLSQFGWKVSVLTVKPGVYQESKQENYSLIPKAVNVVRSIAFDSMRDFSFKGKYLKVLAVPDRWQTWIFFAVLKGFYSFRKNKPDVIFSTYPIPSAHCIAFMLSKLLKKPWVADFRDPMLQDTWPPAASDRKVYRWLEGKIFERASKVIVTTKGTANYYKDRYPVYKEKIEIIPNGFDEEVFNGLSAIDASNNSKVVLLHSGMLSERDRNPEAFFNAVKTLKTENLVSSKELKIVLRASGNEEGFKAKIDGLGIDDIVFLEPSLPYKEALQEMMSVDGLLVFQGETCDRQIPGKLYEYLYAGLPLLALTGKHGDTGELLKELNMNCVANIDSEKDIEVMLQNFLTMIKNDQYPRISRENVMKLSRKHGAVMLSEILGSLT